MRNNFSILFRFFLISTFFGRIAFAADPTFWSVSIVGGGAPEKTTKKMVDTSRAFDSAMAKLGTKAENSYSLFGFPNHKDKKAYWDTDKDFAIGGPEFDSLSKSVNNPDELDCEKLKAFLNLYKKSPATRSIVSVALPTSPPAHPLKDEFATLENLHKTLAHMRLAPKTEALGT